MSSSPNHTASRIVIDCDPGQDDMAAIILAAHSTHLHIESITTVSGNAPVHHTAQNALNIVSALNADIDVYMGAQQPLIHRYEYPYQFHGETGMGAAGVEFRTSSSQVRPTPASTHLIELIDANPGEITIVAMAPMTNLALALTHRPDLAKNIKDIVFMGGSTTVGNVTETAEFNIWADAEAAKIVIRSGVPLSMFGLNVTEQAIFTNEQLESVRDASDDENPVADALQFYFNTNKFFAGEDAPGAPIHDVCPIAHLINPELFKLCPMPVDVITQDGLGYGMTVVDRRPRNSETDIRIRNVNVAMSIDAVGVSVLLEEALCWAAAQHLKH